MEEKKERHGGITTWLYIVVVLNTCLSLYYVYTMIAKSHEAGLIIGYGVLAVGGILNVLSSIMLLKWKLYGFYLFVLVSIVVLVVNIFLLGLGAESITGLVGVVFWRGILQVKKNGLSAWSLLESGFGNGSLKTVYGLTAGTIVLVFAFMVLSFSELSLNSIDNNARDEDIAVERDAEEDLNEIEYVTYTADDGSCSIKAPSDFRRANLLENQSMSLMCTDYDPVVVLLKEDVSLLESQGIKTDVDYANTLVALHKKDTEKESFEKLKEYKNGKGYVIEYKLRIEGNLLYTKLYCIKKNDYFFQCTVYCLWDYKKTLADRMTYMINSFQPL